MMKHRDFWRGLVGALLVAATLSGPVRGQESGGVYTVAVDGLACPFCAYGIERQLGRIEGVGSVGVDIESGTVTVIMQDGAILDEETADSAVEAAGFTMRAFGRPEAGE